MAQKSSFSTGNGVNEFIGLSTVGEWTSSKGLTNFTTGSPNDIELTMSMVSVLVSKELGKQCQPLIIIGIWILGSGYC